MYYGITLRLRQGLNDDRRAQAMGFADGGLAACLLKSIKRARRSWLRGMAAPTLLLAADPAQVWKLAVAAREP